MYSSRRRRAVWRRGFGDLGAAARLDEAALSDGVALEGRRAQK
jgi:hypothetical protein